MFFSKFDKELLRRIRLSLNLTSIYDPSRRNTVYQEIAPGQTPLPYDFLLWNGDGVAYEGVTINGADVLDASMQTIGRVTISAPDGAVGQTLASLAPSSDIPGGDIFFGLPTAHLTAQLTPGDLPGVYVSKIEIFDKASLGLENPPVVSSETLTVRIVPEPSLLGLYALLGGTGLQFARRRRRRPDKS